MTSEGIPAADVPDARAAMRASHADRDRVVEILRDASADGRLTAAELDERVAAALTARTSHELGRLTADLPVPSESTPRAEDLVRLGCHGTTTRRTGKWVVPRRMEISAAGGAVKLDLREAVLTGPRLEIKAELRGGRLVLLTRPGIEVDAGAVAAYGSRVRIRPRRGWHQPPVLAIEVMGEARGSTIVARPPRRPWRRQRRRWLPGSPGLPPGR